MLRLCYEINGHRFGGRCFLVVKNVLSFYNIDRFRRFRLHFGIPMTLSDEFIFG
jgi:hypothetical protein